MNEPHMDTSTTDRLSTRARLTVATLLLALAACGPPGSRPGPASQGPSAPAGTVAPAEASPTPVERLLSHAEVEAIVSDRAATFTRQVALLAGDLTDAELERLVPAVRAAFDPDLLRADIVSFIESEVSDDAIVGEILSSVEEGASAELTRIADAHEPTLTLLEYARSLLDDPPEDRRVRAVVAWVEAQSADEFFVLMEEALNEAAHGVWAAFRPDATPFSPAMGRELRGRLTNSFNASVVSFLRAYETVPDSVLHAATAEYASEAGQWYVDAYALAVAESIRAAGLRVLAELSGPGL